MSTNKKFTKMMLLLVKNNQVMLKLDTNLKEQKVIFSHKRKKKDNSFELK